uniref:Actin-interacting protein 1 n=1 Tax=Hirondellea gigas TaxID=1518452 RepID=A0A6A7FYM9_9CRUS
MPKEPPASKAAFAPLPITARGFGIHINGTLKGSPRLVYANGSHVIIRDLNDPGSSRVFAEHKCAVNVAVFSPNGEWVASGDSEGSVMIWGAKNMIIKNTVRCCRSILDISWSDDGKRVIAVGDGGGGFFGKVFMWDSQNAIGEISNNSKKLLSCAFKPGRPYRVVTVSEEKQVNFYEGPPFKFKQSDRTHTNYPNCVRYSNNGEYFASCGSDKKIVLFDGESGDKIKEFSPSHTGSIYSLSWSPDDSKILTCGGDKTVKMWNVESGSVEKTFTFGKEMSSMQVSCLWLGEYLISVSLSGDINFLDVDNPSTPKKIWSGHQSSIDSIDVSPDGSAVYSGDRDGRICRFECKTSEVEPLKGTGHAGSPIVKLAVSCDGSKLYSVGFDNKLFVSDTTTLAISDSYESFDGQPTCLAASHKDPDLCVVGTSRGLLYVCSGGHESSKLALGFEPTSIGFSPDDDEICVGGKDKLAHIYAFSGTTIGSPGATLDKHTDLVSSIFYSADGKFLTTTDNGRHVFVWNRTDLSTPTNPTGWLFHQARVTQCAWTKDSELLLTCSSDEQVIIWPRAKEGKSSKRKKTDPAHLGGVIDMKILGDSSFATVGVDRFIRIWDIAV